MATNIVKPHDRDVAPLSSAEGGDRTATGPAADPLLQFLAADVPLRVLLQHGAESLDWLASLGDVPVWMSYPDGVGGIALEEVSKIRLLERSHELGWRVVTDPGAFLEFEDAICWQDDAEGDDRVPGVWYAHTECVEWETVKCGVPLAIPGYRLKQIRAEYASFTEQARIARERDAAEAKAKRDEDARQGHEILVAGRIALHRRNGREITREQAEREIEDMVAGFRGIRELAVGLAEETAPPCLAKRSQDRR
ncbi:MULTISPECIES: hypothetical protein [Luteimonas]|uniref:hypothetical protein n=1 Tax=Luteimonas TaxID=83614 RepID=UPI00117D61CE|nr:MULTISPECIES: hypothetical protein [Luteimonas]